MNKELEANATLSHYRIVSKIGEGGMGEVYLAQDTKLDRKVALKILPADVAADRSRLSRFVQEAKAASALNHPNIITIHEIEQLDSMNFIATEFIDGENLRQRMRHASMKAGEVLDVAIQCASALSAAHATAIVHRDIKPENIMIRRDGIVKVLDFGLAKLTEGSAPDSVDTEAPTSFRTEPGTVVGTAAYMSPEQARGTKLDARTDIFSFGVVLYEMVAGRLPFEGLSSIEVTASILSEKESQPLARYSSNVPVELERIVSKALRKNREERYQTIKDMQIDLQSLKQDLEFEKKLERSVPPESKITANILGHAQNETVIESSARPTIGERRATRQKALNKTSLIAVAGLLIIGLGVGGYFYLKSSPSGAIRSIAVLPFANTSDNPDMEYLSDGISESLINDLSKLPGMKVIARSSSFQYKSKEVDATKIANALGVEAILTGRVAQRGDTLLINVEMVDARDKTQVWGEQYNRKTADILQIQSEISREVAEKLRLRLTTGEQQQLVRRERANPQAYELLLKGRFHENKGGTEDLKRAVEYYQQAIAVDPNYGPAYSALSVGYTYLVGFSLVDPKEFMPKAEAAARKALELEESLDEAHLALGNLEMNTWQWVEAEREFKRAIELNPNLFKAHNSYSAYLSAVGRHEEAITEMKRAEELDPLSLFADAELGFALFKARKYDQAIEVLKKCLELDPNYALAHLYLAFTYAAKGMPAEAIAEHKESMRLGINSRGMQIYLGAAYAQAGDHKTALKILKQLETSREYVSPGELPVLYAALGQREEAFASFEKAYLAHDIQLQHLGVEPAFDSLRSDARFKDLMRRVGLLQ
jgi:serine/threonine protein kinase/Tfp pilus assembly protein PilF